MTGNVTLEMPGWVVIDDGGVTSLCRSFGSDGLARICSSPPGVTAAEWAGQAAEIAAALDISYGEAPAGEVIAGLTVALEDAVSSPKGVVPQSAEQFYDQASGRVRRLVRRVASADACDRFVSASLSGFAESLVSDPTISGFMGSKVCCDGSDCGCMGADVSSYILWASGAAPAPFQSRVAPCMETCFGAGVAGDAGLRSDALLEEVLELLQSVGYDQGRVGMMARYVWSREPGRTAQEVGGVMISIAAFCSARGMDMAELGETELARMWSKVDRIRQKQAEKPIGDKLAAYSDTGPAQSGGEA